MQYAREGIYLQLITIVFICGEQNKPDRDVFDPFVLVCGRVPTCDIVRVHVDTKPCLPVLSLLVFGDNTLAIAFKQIGLLKPEDYCVRS